MFKRLIRWLRPIDNSLEEIDLYSSIDDKWKPLFLSLHEYQRAWKKVGRVGLNGD